MRGGLWEQEVLLSNYGEIDFNEVYRIAEEQSVTGLVTSGIEHVSDIKIPKDNVLTFVGSTMQVEHRNKEMNVFISKLIRHLKDKCINTVLIKGQGVAQCYRRPLWRSSGDIDLLLSSDDFEKANTVLRHLSPSYGDVRDFDKHVGYQVNQWEVELHGSLNCGLSFKMEKELDCYYHKIVEKGEVRVWNVDGVDIFLPQIDLDVFVLFTHIIKHFYKGGVGLRQVCDLCMLLWRNNNDIDRNTLRKRLQETGLETEWKVFMAYMVNYLDMPPECAPLYDNDKKWIKKAKRVQDYMLWVGNFGHNRIDFHSKSRMFNLVMGWRQRLKDFAQHFSIFPADTISFFWFIFSGKFVGRFK